MTHVIVGAEDHIKKMRVKFMEEGTRAMTTDDIDGLLTLLEYLYVLENPYD